jgi:hypothetical protein
MRFSAGVPVLVVWTCFAVPSASWGQSGTAGGTDYRAEGLWWGVGVGGGGTRLTCDLCETSRELGPAVEVAVGAWAGPSLRVGVEAGMWSHDDQGVRENVLRAGIVGLAYPRPGSGLHLIGGAGWSGYRADAFAYDAVRVSMGLGWDLRLTRGWVVGNRVTLDASSFGSLRNGGTAVVRGVGLSTVRFGVYLDRR